MTTSEGRYLGCIAVVVRDYDEAIDWYTRSLGFVLIEDNPLAESKRWVLVSPSHASRTRILLARAVGAEQEAAIGRQTGGRVFLFLHTDDFERDHAAFRARGVRFLEAPRDEPYGRVAVFEDLYGNRWDLLEPGG
jgi:catechol 2,3-dioxygenase-like lactoylglutathione lyase family enzyme